MGALAITIVGALAAIVIMDAADTYANDVELVKGEYHIGMEGSL